METSPGPNQPTRHRDTVGILHVLLKAFSVNRGLRRQDFNAEDAEKTKLD
jgi:hypothetical protein